MGKTGAAKRLLLNYANDRNRVNIQGDRNIGFTGTLKVIRRAIADFQDANSKQLPFFFSKLIREILEQTIPQRQGRTNPRVVKKTRSKFPYRKPIHRGTGTKHQSHTFFILNTA